MPRAVAVTLTLQLTVGLLMLAFGATCLLVARRARESAHAPAWLLTGVVFSGVGAHASLQGVMAFAAMAAGAGSGLYAGYVRWMPAFNNARTVVVLAYGVLLGALLLRRGSLPVSPAVLSSSVALLLAVGTALGGFQHGFSEARDYSFMAWIEIVSVVLLLAVLYGALFSTAVDYLLWAAVGIYAMRAAVNASWLSVASWIGVARVWQPGARTMFGIAIFALLLMLACTARRLAMARAGKDPPSLLERLRL